MLRAFPIFLIFLLLIAVAGLRNRRRIPRELDNLANDLGVVLKRTWGPQREDGELGSPFVYGPGYTGVYRQSAIDVSSVVDAEGGAMGTRMRFHFLRPLALSLFCACNIETFAAKIIQDEYRDMFLKRVVTGLDDIKAWAKDKDKAVMLLMSGDVSAHLKRLAGLVHGINGIDAMSLPGLRRVGFMVNDQGVSLFVTHPSLLKGELADEAFMLTQALSASGLGNACGSVAAKGQSFRVLIIMLMILLAGFIIGAMVTGGAKFRGGSGAVRLGMALKQVVQGDR